MKPSGWNVGKQYVHLFPSLETRSLVESKRENKNRGCQDPLQVHIEDSRERERERYRIFLLSSQYILTRKHLNGPFLKIVSGIFISVGSICSRQYRK